MKNSYLYIFTLAFILAGCGGGGGGGGSAPTTPSTPAPTVNLSADPTSVLLESTSTLTWSSTNATSCSASWTSQTGTSGSEAVTIATVGNNSFSISCTGDGGSGSASVTVEGYRNTDGVVVDGYISGAEVCIDEDENWTCDASENSTTSDNEGKFTIRYANGNLVSIGGTDLDSQTLLDNLLITHKLTGHSDFKAVTPVTSVAAFMEDASLVNAALGIDASIDVFTFDPVANKGDGGIYDYLYEKGNQLTVLAFALQNITNNLNTTTETTQDYFKAITEEIEKEYTETETKVDIETEAFVTKALDNVIAAKSLTIDETAKANTAKALASILPVIEVKSSDDLTTSVIRFAVSTLQTDIQAIADGTATSEIVTSYTNDVLAYIAEDQNIDADEITPDISAIADSASTSEDTIVEINVLLNDSYLTSSPISVTAGNGTNGTTSVASNVVTYDPDADYNGTDTFSYTITQGDKTSSADVTVTIEAVNDAPSIDLASTIQVQENQTAVTTVSVSDVDEDELTLTLGGTDADSFNLSDENVLTFKEAPDYETQTYYSIALSLTDGIETVTKDINLNIQDIGEFYGSAIDGYISGANIFIDQNFNFLKDEGELSATTDSDGKFEIFTEDLSLYECLKNRPIVADVPVGAVDSTLGEVAKAYQMILPSLNDSGPEKVVVSPFSSLFSEQITNAIADLKLENELTIAEGCQSIGDNIASNISIKIQELKSTLDSLGITYDELTDNFISSPNGIISETTAQNIAQFLPSIASIKLILNTEMSNNFGFEINPSLIIGQDTINVIFDPNRVEDITEMPVTLFTSFSSETNSSGWYKQSTITANGSKLDSISNLIPYKCYSSNSQDCLEKDITLDVLANYSKDYRNSVGWFRSVNKNNPISIGVVVNGSIEVSSSDVRYYDDSNENTLHSCGVEEIIQLTGSKVNEIGHAYQYQTNYNEGTGLQNGCNISSDFRRATIEIRKFGTDVNGNEESLSTSYVTNNIDTSNLFSSKPVNLFNDFENVDPLGIINEIANLEFNFSKFSSIRSSLASGERAEFRYSLRHSNGQFSKQYVLTLSSMSANDSFLLETYDENGTITSTNNISGIGALQSYSNQILDEASNASSIIDNNYYSNESPVITSTNTFSLAENQTTIGTVTATDAEGDDVSFTVSGSELAITSAGVLTFVSAPDYETKVTYTATVTASDGVNSTTQGITVNVTNVNDNSPSFTSDATFSADENQTAIGTVMASDADGDGITYSISGSDITINASSGVIAFASAPDYETKPVYTATVTASDGAYSITQLITINVNDINECLVGEDESSFLNSKLVCSLSGTITEDVTLSDPETYLYRLNGKVSVGVDTGGDGTKSGGVSATLTIEPGTSILAYTSNDYLVINRGSKIIANGTSAAPIRFTHKTAIEGTVGENDRGLWGGIIILGKAPINKCSNDVRGTAACERVVEGSNDLMGGATTNDSSGTLKYVRVEYAGYEIFPGNELNGITFGGVGNGTVVDYIQVHNNQDDCVEIFGGNVNFKHLICTGAHDDSLDMDWGYQGKMQYVIVQQTDGFGDHVVESDNTNSDTSVGYLTEPRTNPIISNFTFLSSGRDEIFKFNEGSSGQYLNGIALVKSGSTNCMQIEDFETAQDGAITPNFSMNSVAFQCNGFITDVDSIGSFESIVKDGANNLYGANSGGGSYVNTLSGIRNGSAEAAATVTAIPDAYNADGFFDVTDYIGAVKNSSTAWYSGWILSGSLNDPPEPTFGQCVFGQCIFN